MTEQAKGSSELLNDLLVNKTRSSGGGGLGAPSADEFEMQLTQELLGDVRTMREGLQAYLEQLGNIQGPDAEKAVCEALEAIDLLDGALALEKVRCRWRRHYHNVLCTCMLHLHMETGFSGPVGRAVTAAPLCFVFLKC
jgi:hypothetical protein